MIRRKKGKLHLVQVAAVHLDHVLRPIRDAKLFWSMFHVVAQYLSKYIRPVSKYIFRNISAQYLSKYIPWRHLDALVARVPIHGGVFQENPASKKIGD